MSDARPLARLVPKKPSWKPFDPDNSEEIEQILEHDFPSNFFDIAATEGPSVKPGEILFTKEFRLTPDPGEPEQKHDVNIFLDNPKSSVIILSLGLIDDELLFQSIDDGTLGPLLTERLKDAIDVLSRDPGA